MLIIFELIQWIDNRLDATKSDTFFQQLIEYLIDKLPMSISLLSPLINHKHSSFAIVSFGRLITSDNDDCLLTAANILVDATTSDNQTTWNELVHSCDGTETIETQIVTSIERTIDSNVLNRMITAATLLYMQNMLSITVIDRILKVFINITCNIYNIY
jgi:hypothetical protein